MKDSFKNLDEATSYLWGLPSHGGFKDRDAAKDAAINLVNNGTYKLKDYTGTSGSPETYVKLRKLSDTTPNTQYKASAYINGKRDNYTLVYGENGEYTLYGEDGQTYSSKDLNLFNGVKIVDEENRSYYQKSDGYTTLQTASSEGNRDTRINGVGSSDQPDMHDSIMHHTHVTKTSDENTFVDMMFRGDKPAVLNTTGPVQVYCTKQDLISQLTSTRQWSTQDAAKYVSDLEASGKYVFATGAPVTRDKYFVGKYVEWYNSLVGTNSTERANQLKAEVETLRAEFELVKNQMEDWFGSAADSAKDAIGCILGKFIVTMGNIENALLPACQALDELLLKLEEMKKEDELLQKLLLELKTLDSNVPVKDIKKTRKIKIGMDSNGKVIYDNETYYIDNPDYKQWEKNVKLKEEEIRLQREKLDKIVIEVEELILRISNYQQAVQQFSSFVSAGGSNHYMISSAENIIKYHDDILYEFENFAEMPVITNLSDYRVGDIVLFDDSYGTLYKVIEVFDADGKPTGYLKIIAVDKNGKVIEGARPITIWDQREICPVPKGTAPHTTAPPTKPTSPPTKPTAPPTTAPPTIPTVPPTTAPPTIPGTGIPNTGINGIANSGMTKDSNKASLAGIALGAAGLGMAAMLQDDEEEDKEEKSKDKKDEPSKSLDDK